MELPADTEDDLIAALTALRVQRRMTRAQLGRAAGVQADDISEYERGLKVPSRATLERLAAALGVSWSFLEVLALLYRRLGHPTTTAASVRAATVALDQVAVAEGLCRFPRPAITARAGDVAPSVLWSRLSRHPPEVRSAVVEEFAEFQTWDFCAFLCDESVRVAADDPNQPVEIAQLALVVAELLPETKARRARAQGRVWAFLGNALRVAGRLLAADRAFSCSAELWEAGARDPGPLAEDGRLLDLEASLRRAQRRLPEALTLLKRALEADRDGTAAGRLLVKRAKTLTELGDYREAVATLHRASPLIDGTREPRLLWVHRFNLVEILYYQGEHAEAEAMLPELRELCAQRGQLDRVRLLWLEGRITAGLRRLEEGITALDRVRAAFTEHGIAYDAALVTLELAVLYLEQGRSADVKTLAPAMAWIFKAQGVEREHLATLRLFCEAAEQERITVELVRSYLEALGRPAAASAP